MSKHESALIEKINKAISEAAKYGIFHAGVTLLKSKNTWTFSGHPMMVEALSVHSDVILPTLEAATIEIESETNEMVRLGETDYRTQTVLPPLPAPLTKLSLVASRSYVANSLSILTGIHDSRLLYKRPPPEWWPEEIPYAKPGLIPQSLMDEFGSGGSSEWHLRLRAIIYVMYRHVHQDYRKNVDAEGWRSFLKRYE